jgi:hypothetical protein
MSNAVYKGAVFFFFFLLSAIYNHIYVSHWSCDSTDLNTVSNPSWASKQSNVRFSKVLIVNNTATACITKDARMPGSTKSAIDHYFSS